jgi:hypothetical protein
VCLVSCLCSSVTTCCRTCPASICTVAMHIANGCAFFPKGAPLPPALTGSDPQDSFSKWLQGLKLQGTVRKQAFLSAEPEEPHTLDGFVDPSSRQKRKALSGYTVARNISVGMKLCKKPR